MSNTVSNNNQKEEIPPVPVVSEEQEIDLIELAGKIWAQRMLIIKERMLIIKVCSIAVVVALIVAFSLPKEYTTTVQLAPESTENASPESTENASKMRNLGGLAAIAGINLNSILEADAISLDLYPDVIQSTPFMLELFPIEVKDIEGTLQTTVYEYIDEHQRSAWWGHIFRAPFFLFWVEL